jgi:hypothetical protein
MKMPEMNHQAKRTQKAVPVQRWHKIANRFKDTGRVYRRHLMIAFRVTAAHAPQFDLVGEVREKIPHADIRFHSSS